MEMIGWTPSSTEMLCECLDPRQSTHDRCVRRGEVRKLASTASMSAAEVHELGCNVDPGLPARSARLGGRRKGCAYQRAPRARPLRLLSACGSGGACSKAQGSVKPRHYEPVHLARGPVLARPQHVGCATTPRNRMHTLHCCAHAWPDRGAHGSGVLCLTSRSRARRRVAACGRDEDRACGARVVREWRCL